MNQIIMTVVVVIGVTAVFSLVAQRQKKKAYRGEVVDKFTVSDDDAADQYFAVIKDEISGKQMKVNISCNLYNELKTGDRLEKKSGEYIPSKI